MSGLIEHILSLSGWLALLIVFAVPALESSAFLGFFFPGETALILGGVLASYGRVSLWAVLVAGISGAIIGDSVGYLVGREYGRRLLESRPLRRVLKPGRIDRGVAGGAMRRQQQVEQRATGAPREVSDRKMPRQHRTPPCRRA